MIVVWLFIKNLKFQILSLGMHGQCDIIESFINQPFLRCKLCCFFRWWTNTGDSDSAYRAGLPRTEAQIPFGLLFSKNLTGWRNYHWLWRFTPWRHATNDAPIFMPEKVPLFMRVWGLSRWFYIIYLI